MTLPSITLFYGPNHRLNEAQFAALAGRGGGSRSDFRPATKFRFCLSNLLTSHSASGVSDQGARRSPWPDAVVEAFLTRIDDISFAALATAAAFVTYVSGAFLAGRN